MLKYNYMAKTLTVYNGTLFRKRELINNTILEDVMEGCVMDPTMIIMIVAMIGIFYFFMIRPENKKKKKLAEMRSSLAAGDTITTIGGIFGKVVQVADDKITFETGEDRVRIQVAKWAVSTVGKATEEPPK